MCCAPETTVTQCHIKSSCLGNLCDALVKIWALYLMLFCHLRNAGSGMEWHPPDWKNLWRSTEYYYSTVWGSRNMCKTVSFSPSFCFHFFLWLFMAFFFFFFLKFTVVKVEPLLAWSISVIINTRIHCECGLVLRSVESKNLLSLTHI